MKIVHPVLLGLNTEQANTNETLKSHGHKVVQAGKPLFKESSEYDFLQRFAGYKSITVVAAKKKTDATEPEEIVKSYMPRFLSGLFDGFSLVLIGSDIIVAEIYRKN